MAFGTELPILRDVDIALIFRHHASIHPDLDSGRARIKARAPGAVGTRVGWATGAGRKPGTATRCRTGRRSHPPYAGTILPAESIPFVCRLASEEYSRHEGSVQGVALGSCLWGPPLVELSVRGLRLFVGRLELGAAAGGFSCGSEAARPPLGSAQMVTLAGLSGSSAAAGADLTES